MRPERIVWVGYFTNREWKTSESKYADALRRLGVEVIGLDPPWDQLEQLIDGSKIDCVIFSRCEDFGADRLARIRRRPDRPLLIQVLFDPMDYQERLLPGLAWPTRSRLARWLPMAQQFDVVVAKERGRFADYAARGVRCEYLDQAAELPGLRENGTPFNEVHDVAFIGQRNLSRAQRFQFIARDFDAIAYGPKWRQWRWRHPRIRNGGTVHGESFIRAVRTTKVVWGENRRHDIEGYWSDRVYRVLAAGGVFLTRYTPGLDKVFENGRHLVWYDTLQQARELLEALVNDDAWRKSLRSEGRALIERSHTYDHRASELIDLITRVAAR